MTTRAIASAALIAALLAAGTAQAANNCVFVRNLNDFKPANDEKSMILSDSPSRKYNVTFMSRCIGLKFTETLAVRAVGGQFCLTPGDSIAFSDGLVRRQCMIDKIEPISTTPHSAPAGGGQDGGG
jgi:hypothetical protein